MDNINSPESLDFMHVLIVDSNTIHQENITIAFMDAGYQVTPTTSVKVAKTCIQRCPIDLLVITERVDNRLTHSLALMAEYRNALVSTMMLTDRTDSDADELFQLLPSLHYMLPLDVSPELITKLAIATMIKSADLNSQLISKPSDPVVSVPDYAPIASMAFVARTTNHAEFDLAV